MFGYSWNPLWMIWAFFYLFFPFSLHGRNTIKACWSFFPAYHWEWGFSCQACSVTAITRHSHCRDGSSTLPRPISPVPAGGCGVRGTVAQYPRRFLMNLLAKGLLAGCITFYTCFSFCFFEYVSKVSKAGWKEWS